MASYGVNKCIVMGRLGGEVDFKSLPNGQSVATISVATSERWQDKATGDQREKTEWHRVVIFGRLAEIAHQYLKKGSQVYVEGQLQTRKWQDNAGIERYTTEIIVQGYNGVMQLLGSRNDAPVPLPNQAVNNPVNQNTNPHTNYQQQPQQHQQAQQSGINHYQQASGGSMSTQHVQQVQQVQQVQPSPHGDDIPF